MIRLIIQRKTKDQWSGAETVEFVTVDADIPELQEILFNNGFEENGYDFRSLIGCEMIKDHV